MPAPFAIGRPSNASRQDMGVQEATDYVAKQTERGNTHNTRFREAEKLAGRPQPTITPTVLSDTTIRDKVIPDLNQQATSAVQKYDQAGQAIQQQGQLKQAQENEKAKTKDPLDGLFNDKSTQAPVDPFVQKQLDLLDQMSKSRDSATRLQAETQQRNYERQRQAEMQLGSADQATARTSLNRLGGRYTPGAQGQVMSQIQRSTNEKLAEIDDKEADAIEQLRLAQEQKDFQDVGSKLEILKGVRDERQQALEAAQKAAQDAKKEVSTVLKAAAESGAPSDVLQAIGGADDIVSATIAAGEYLQQGEYAEYARAVKNAGLTPVDPTTYYSKKIYGEKGPPGSEPFGGNIPFEATIDGAASLAGSVTGEESAAKQLKALAAMGDYPALLTRMEALGRKGMGADAGKEVFNAQNQVKAITDLQEVLNEYEAKGGELGPLPATEKALSAKLGQLSGDPRYSELATRMTAAFQKYRQEMSGAAFGVKENEEYKKVIPTADKSFELNKAVINGLKEFLSNNVDNAYETQLGEGYKNVKDYVDQGLTPDGKKLLKTEQEAKDYALRLSESDPVFEEQVANVMADNPEWSYQETLENMGISASSMSGKVSMAGGNRPQRNNNPGNVKIGGLGDQYAKKGPDGKPLTDEQGHLVFATPEDGAKAIRADINAKLSGNSPAAERKLGRQIITLADLNKVYAEDPNWKNNVARYAGVSPDAKVNAIPRETLINAIMKAEGFFA